MPPKKPVLKRHIDLHPLKAVLAVAPPYEQYQPAKTAGIVRVVDL